MRAISLLAPVCLEFFAAMFAVFNQVRFAFASAFSITLIFFALLFSGGFGGAFMRAIFFKVLV